MPLWGTANLFSNPRYQAGAATNPDPEVFAYAAAQVAHCLDATHRLGGHNYVLWGGREGYETLLKALKNKKHPEHKSMKEWLGRPFDPESFDVAKANHWLRKLKWPRATEGQLRKILTARDGYVE